MKMVYEKEIDQILRSTFHENYMDIDEYNEVILTVFSQLGINKQTLNRQIEVGIKNGFSLEFQLGLIDIILKINKNNDRF